MIRLALAELRRHPGRVVAVLLAVMISVGFLGGSSVFLATESQALGRAATAALGQADVVVQPNGEIRPTAQVLATLRSTPGVDAVAPRYRASADFRIGTGTTAPSGSLDLTSAADDPRFAPGRLVSGRWPTGPDEVALAVDTASRTRLGLGSSLTLSGIGGGARTRDVTVVGTVDAGRSLLGGLRDSGFAAPALFAGDPAFSYLVAARGGTDPATVAATVQRTLGSDVEVQTAAAVRADTVRSLGHGVDVFRIIALVFGAIALLVGAMIIVNTFAILVVQRRRQIGLLRVVGADAGTVRRSLLVEATVVGAVGALLGVGLSLAAGAAATAITGSLSAGLAVPWPTVLGCAAGGLVVTVLAAAVPTRAALAVSPLEALRPVADEAAVARGGRVRVVVAAALAVVGAGLVTLGLTTDGQSLLLAVAGSLLLAVAVLLLARTLLPPLIRLVGRVAGLLGPVGRLATANALRNPGRAAVTCTALMLAVGMIVTLQVGSSSVRQTVISQLNARYPVDLTVTALEPGAVVPDRTLAALRAVPGVRVAVPVAAAPATVGRAGAPKSDRTTMLVEGPGADAAPATRSGLGDLSDSAVLATRFTLRANGWDVGDRIAVRIGDRSTTLPVRSSNLGDDNTLVVTRATLLRLDPALATRSGTAAVWASVPDIDASPGVAAAVRGLTAAGTGLSAGGSLAETASYTTLLGVLVSIATALLGVAVLIALIGVGNTLGLSVLERTRESALLRALGLHRRQLRAMLVVEAVLLALVAALVGVAVGTGFGWLGTLAITRQSGLGSAEFAMSATRTLTVVAVAVLAGALASALPARRAARATPVEALADE